MSSCHDMKLNEVYVCEDCGLELKVTKECCQSDEEKATCKCEPCKITCCDHELKKKE